MITSHLGDSDKDQMDKETMDKQELEKIRTSVEWVTPAGIQEKIKDRTFKQVLAELELGRQLFKLRKEWATILTRIWITSDITAFQYIHEIFWAIEHIIEECREANNKIISYEHVSEFFENMFKATEEQKDGILGGDNAPLTNEFGETEALGGFLSSCTRLPDTYEERIFYGFLMRIHELLEYCHDNWANKMEVFRHKLSTISV